jgi:hypothetical protein
MIARDFCFWLQGAVELGGLAAPLSDNQVDVVARHLSLVVLSTKPVNELPSADALVYRMRALHEAGAAWDGKVWDTLMSQLHDVFEHQLDHEVPHAPGHSHGGVMRC